MKYRLTITPKTRQTRDIEAESAHEAVKTFIAANPGYSVEGTCLIVQRDIGIGHPVEEELEYQHLEYICVCGKPIFESESFILSEDAGVLCVECAHDAAEHSEDEDS